jgi:hypothetical protein
MRLRIKASIWFPLEGADWPRKLLLGGVTGLLIEVILVGLTFIVSEEAAFGLAPLAVMLNFPVLGYILRVYEGTLSREVGSLPEWEDWLGLLRKGLAGFGISLVYGVLPLLLILLGFGLLVKGGILLFFGMVLMVLGVLAGVFVIFFLPMAMARFLGKRRIEAAFHPGIIWEGINAILAEYVATYLFSVGFFILGGVVAAIPYFGGLLWPFLCFYLTLVQARLFGEICAKVA